MLPPYELAQQLVLHQNTSRENGPHASRTQQTNDRSKDIFHNVFTLFTVPRGRLCTKSRLSPLRGCPLRVVETGACGAVAQPRSGVQIVAQGVSPGLRCGAKTSPE